jgi:hypothetical protein
MAIGCGCRQGRRGQVRCRVACRQRTGGVECRDDVSNWGDVEGEQDRPKDRTLGDSMFTDKWR